MPNVMPEGEAIRKAVKWVSAELQENPKRTTQELVNDAISKFDLSPKDADFLLQFYRRPKSD